MLCQRRGWSIIISSILLVVIIFSFFSLYAFIVRFNSITGDIDKFVVEYSQAVYLINKFSNDNETLYTLILNNSHIVIHRGNDGNLVILVSFSRIATIKYVVKFVY